MMLCVVSLICHCIFLNFFNCFARSDKYAKCRLYCTVGVHPHDAKSFNKTTITAMKQLLTNRYAVAVGETGLDYNRNFSSKEDQQKAFRAQIELACELNMPVFLHEREAHSDLVAILVDIGIERLPPIVVHCFTGTSEEAHVYLKMGFYLGFTGTFIKKVCLTFCFFWF